MTTKKSSTAPEETVVVIRFPGAFTLFKPSMQALRSNIFTILEAAGIILGVFVLAVLPFMLANTDNNALRVPMAILAGLCGVAAIVLVVIANAGFTALQVKAARGKVVSLSEAFADGRKFAWRVLGLSIVVTLVLLVGLLLFIIPFFFMLRRYYLAPFFLVDRDLGIFAAMKQSAAESKRYSSAVWGLLGVEFVIFLLSVIPYVGIIANPVASLLYNFAPAIRYVQMREAAEKNKVLTAVA